MKSYFTIAWRNIWRNKRRTLITAASIFFALVLALFMRALQLGSYGAMKKNMVESFSGAIQIHAKGYWDDKTIDNCFAVNSHLLETLRAEQGVKQVSSRIETGLLAAFGAKSKVAWVVGSDLQIEDENLNLKPKLVAGTFPSAHSTDILVGQGLAKYLNATVGDSIVFKGVGYHGQTAEGLFRVAGLVKFPAPALNKQITFVNLATAQSLFGLTGKASAIAINIDKLQEADKLKAQLTKHLNSAHEIMTWVELNPSLHQQIESDQGGGLIMLYMLYLIVGFGIVGTVIMMTTERQREFGVMVAVGMRKTKLALVMIIELFYLGGLSVLAAMLTATPLIYLLHINPIPIRGEMAKNLALYGMEPHLPFAFEPSFFLEQGKTVLIMVMCCALLPLYSIGRLKVVDALKK